MAFLESTDPLLAIRDMCPPGIVGHCYGYRIAPKETKHVDSAQEYARAGKCADDTLRSYFIGESRGRSRKYSELG